MTTLTTLSIALVKATEVTNDHTVDAITDQMLEHIANEKYQAQGYTLGNTDVFSLSTYDLQVLLSYLEGKSNWSKDEMLTYNIADSRLQSLQLEQGDEDYEDGPDSFDGDSYGAYTIS